VKKKNHSGLGMYHAAMAGSRQRRGRGVVESTTQARSMKALT